MKQFELNLKKYQKKAGDTVVKVFTGRDFGKHVREDSKLDTMFADSDSIKFIIPDNTFSITPSFLEELFVNIVDKYGKEELIKKLDIKGNSYDIETPLLEAIARIMQKHNGLNQ